MGNGRKHGGQNWSEWNGVKIGLLWRALKCLLTTSSKALISPTISPMVHSASTKLVSPSLSPHSLTQIKNSHPLLYIQNTTAHMLYLNQKRSENGSLIPSALIQCETRHCAAMFHFTVLNIFLVCLKSRCWKSLRCHLSPQTLVKKHVWGETEKGDLSIWNEEPVQSSHFSK